ncbi:hypothetical protein Asp14428_42790 [Actinoplanes sp. NBRC 14428]|nr:hypothetical protein Asp14428_42790 [Actinoplanes sp. NBRC 14428]
MGYGEVWWFFRDEGIESLDSAVAALRDAGLVAGNPATGTPQIIDDNGVQVPWDAAEVGRRWFAGELITAQLWLNPETDVLVEFVRPARLLTFDLDGMTTAEARFTVFAVLNAALSLAGTQAVVTDKNLPDRGEELLEAPYAALRFKPDLLVSVAAEGRYAVEVGSNSWLSA